MKLKQITFNMFQIKINIIISIWYLSNFLLLFLTKNFHLVVILKVFCLSHPNWEKTNSVQSLIYIVQCTLYKQVACYSYFRYSSRFVKNNTKILKHVWIIIKNKEECKQRAVAQRNEQMYVDVECAMVWVCMYEKKCLSCLRKL